ncbi:MFS transporter [Kibdelosporangium philippinense]|uniref:MFS transporter n=1 Tax=Kibdelosporangium philippinense TaxID=211113 RepID=A0ABS8ZGN7_9PSEU|nr:MFS transporter [Kibdelosporangium philippinense]MCE7006998.1 MFS transporter [Kibdelosporangium philippinense]
MRPSRDQAASAGGAALFSCSLGIASVAFPLVALRAGYSVAEVGFLTAVSAVAQMATRFALGWVMRRVGDWVLIVGAGVTLGLSSGLVVMSVAVVPFTIAQLLQGVARACYWTGSQTHVVRGDRRPVGALATINFVSSFGLLVGPVLAGVLIEISAQLALILGAVVACAAIVPALLLDRLPPFQPPADRPPGGIWRRPGVDVGCWAGVSAGAWRGLLGSFVPVALDSARQSSSTVGALVTVANGTALIGAAIVGRVRGQWIGRSFVLGTIAAGGGIGLVVPVAESWPLAAVLLGISGLGAGALQTIGPAIATVAVHPEERGEAIAAAGTFRAAALFGGPLAVSGAVLAFPLTAAMGAIGVLIAVSAAVVRGRGAALVQPS